MKMKVMTLVFLAAMAAQAVEVTSVVAKQRWPWNNLVDVDFMLTGAAGERYLVEIDAQCAGGAKKFTAMTFASDPVVLPGVNRVTWDFGKDYPGVRAEDMSFAVSVIPHSESTKPLYLCIDLSAGSTAVSYPIRYSSTGPIHVQGARNEPCQTTELWLRRVTPPKSRQVLYGGAYGSATYAYYAQQTKDYYIGVFELTEKQYERVMGEWNSDAYFTNEAYRASRPLHNVRPSKILGNGRNPATHPELIPAESLLGRLRAKTGLALSLPTIAQFEYATRAGKETSMVKENYSRYSVNGVEAEAGTIMRYSENAGTYDENSDDSVGLATVGSYAPNDFGLYDTMGNAREHTCEFPNGYKEPVVAKFLAEYRTSDPELGKSGTPLIDPKGAWPNCSSTTYTIAQRTAFNDDRTSLFTLWCYDMTKATHRLPMGARLSITVE